MTSFVISKKTHILLVTSLAFLDIYCATNGTKPIKGINIQERSEAIMINYSGKPLPSPAIHVPLARFTAALGRKNSLLKIRSQMLHTYSSLIS